MNNNYRSSPYSRETNNLKQNGISINVQQIPVENNPNSDNNSLEGNTNYNNQNNYKKESQILVEFNCCGTPYFTFGKTLFFYCPHSLKNTEISKQYYSTTVNLSEMPDPLFSIGPECKFYFFIFYFYLRR